MLPSIFGSWPRVAPNNGGAKFGWRPTADISETPQEYLIRAELPAVKKEDVQVTIDSNVITIQGERKHERVDDNERAHRIESFHGTFSRSFVLPNDVNTDAIRCESKDGVLTVHVPKAQTQKQKPKQITVE
jgi:HSP20 family protein